MPLFRTSKTLVLQIDEFLDTVAEGALVFREGVLAYLAGDLEEFAERIKVIDELERRADELSKDVETKLYSQSLIPEYRGDVLGLLETTDNVIDTAKTNLFQFSVERPRIPAEHLAGFQKLAEASCEAAQAVVVAARVFFRDPQAVKDHLFKVHHFEHQADGLGDTLKRRVFDGELELAQKIHLRYFALNIEKVSDRAKEVADRLAIYAIKRSI